MPEDRTPIVLRLPADLLALVETYTETRQCTRTAAILELIRLGLGGAPSVPLANPSQALLDAMAYLKRDGMGYAQIGRVVGLSRQRVHEILNPLTPETEGLNPE